MNESESHPGGDERNGLDRVPGDEPASSRNGIQRRIVLGSALRALAIGGIAAGGIVGCTSTARQLRSLPDPDLPASGRMAGSSRRPLPVTPKVESTPGMPGVLARSSWTNARPNYRGMDKHTKPLHCITVHHDGLDFEKHAFTSTRSSAAKARLLLYHGGHVNHNGWADIGYHFAIDRAGQVWECRPLAYQGAHVRGRNDGNVGILVMGNFDVQRPSSAQVRALSGHVNALCLSFGIKRNAVHTHKEWKGAKTACPGKHLQAQVNTLRRRDFRA